LFLLKQKKSVSATRKSKRVAMRQKRKLESANETLLRQMKDSIRKAQKRGLETEEQALQRKKIDRAYQSTKRALETTETFHTQEQYRTHKAKKKVSETPAETSA